MCTAATYQTKDFYFGRTLDYEFSYGDEIVITPRNYVFQYRHMGRMEKHYAMIGMAHVAEGYPLYYEAVNEKGLGVAGLNFVGNADYKEPAPGKENIAQFELIPWILGQCASVKEARELLLKVNLVNTPFSDKLPLAQLHWMIADAAEAVTLESVKEGVRIYDNPAGVLTNNPPFPAQMFQLNNYMHLSPKELGNLFSDRLSLHPYSRGMGALGLPGDLSSQSRFIRAAFTRLNSVSGDSEEESVSQFFHILGSVDQQRGCCVVEETDKGCKYEITIYTACCNASKGIYYYTTYDNHQITALHMYNENLEADTIIRYTPVTGEQIRRQN
ncbi:MAG: choloylglycine hydrolase [Blautia sp.]|nr:choloylglycine hydrolase [Blautia sp.]MCM1201234.1 choloylglycine hydrolase [Bacteroides fragilis]